MENNLDKYFVKSDLIPAVIQEKSTGEVLMVAWMNKESMLKHLKQAILGFGVEVVRNYGIKVQHQAIFKRLLKFIPIVMMILY